MDIHRSMELNAFEDFPSLFNPFMGDTYTAPVIIYLSFYKYNKIYFSLLIFMECLGL